MITRRSVLIGTVGVLAAPAILRAQTNSIKIGHLAPLTGAISAVGRYASMGATVAAEKINAAGGILGREVQLIIEDSVNPATASNKAERMVNIDKVDFLQGESSSPSAVAIMQVAERSQKIFMHTGGNSDKLRGEQCNRVTFHCDAMNTMYVNTMARSMLRDGRVTGKKWYMLTADYAFGHDLTRVVRRFGDANGANFIGEDLVPLDVADFSPYLLKVRQAQPDVVIINLSGLQVTNFIKQYYDLGLEFPLAGASTDIALAWAAGRENFSGEWPVIWLHTLDNPESKAFTATFTSKYNEPPENQAWSDYVGLTALAQACNETKSIETGRLIEYFEKGATFESLKSRPSYFRSWDHQIMTEMFMMKPIAADAKADKWNWLTVGPPLPNADQPLEILAPTAEENACHFKA